MAALTVADIVAAGLDITAAADVQAAAGDLIPNGDGRSFLVINNAGATQMTVTATAQHTTLSREGFPTVPVADKVAIVPAGKYYLMGPFERGAFNDGNGRVVISYGTVTSVKVRAVRLPSAG